MISWSLVDIHIHPPRLHGVTCSKTPITISKSSNNVKSHTHSTVMQKLPVLLSRILGPKCKDTHIRMCSYTCKIQIQITSKSDNMGTIKNTILERTCCTFWRHTITPIFLINTKQWQTCLMMDNTHYYNLKITWQKSETTCSLLVPGARISRSSCILTNTSAGQFTALINKLKIFTKCCSFLNKINI